MPVLVISNHGHAIVHGVQLGFFALALAFRTRVDPLRHVAEQNLCGLARLIDRDVALADHATGSARRLVATLNQRVCQKCKGNRGSWRELAGHDAELAFGYGEKAHMENAK